MNYYQYRMCGKGRLKSWLWAHEDALFIIGTVWLLAWMLTW